MNGKEPKQIPPQRPRARFGLLTWLIIFILAVLVASRFVGTDENVKITYDQYKSYLDKGSIYYLKKADNTLTGKLQGESQGRFVVSIAGLDSKVVDEDINQAIAAQSKKGIRLEFVASEGSTPLINFLIGTMPWIVLLVIMYFLFIRPMMRNSGAGGMFSFGKSRAQMITKEKIKTTFEDVAGIEEAKDQVAEIIGFLKNPAKFTRLGGRIPKGVLLVGSPGTGKTLLAKAIAGEAGVPFFSICGSDFVEMFVGVGASRVRDLFMQAKEQSPSVIFLDEIDAVGRRRGTGLGGGHDEREQTLNAILVEMDGFDSDTGVIVIAATNRPDVLDPALLRSGRFDRQIQVDLPDVKGREAILKVHCRKIKLGDIVDLAKTAKFTPSFSGADLENLVNEAAIIAVMKNKEFVEMEDFEEARDKVLWGVEKKSRVMDQEDRKITAIHEAGHALMTILSPKADPLHKISIIPRGPMLGATMQLPEKDSYNMTKEKLLSQIRILYAGRIAEDMFCGDITTGAQNDIARATNLARKMVSEWGMSEELGPISYHAEQEHIFLGREISKTQDHSDEIARKIDYEIKKVIEQCYDEAYQAIKSNSEKLEVIAEGLLEYEVLSSEEVQMLLEGKELPGREPVEKSHDIRVQEKEKPETLTRVDYDGGLDAPPAPAAG